MRCFPADGRPDRPFRSGSGRPLCPASVRRLDRLREPRADPARPGRGTFPARGWVETRSGARDGKAVPGPLRTRRRPPCWAPSECPENGLWRPASLLPTCPASRGPQPRRPAPARPTRPSARPVGRTHIWGTAGSTSGASRHPAPRAQGSARALGRLSVVNLAKVRLLYEIGKEVTGALSTVTSHPRHAAPLFRNRVTSDAVPHKAILAVA